MEQKRKRRTENVPRSTSAVLKSETLELDCGERSVYSFTLTSKITQRQEQISNEAGRNCFQCQEHGVVPLTQFIASRFVGWANNGRPTDEQKAKVVIFLWKSGVLL